MKSMFSHSNERCTLRAMRKRRVNKVMAALLLFQLAFGLQWQVAHAIVLSPDMQASGIGAPCPDHATKDSTANNGTRAAASGAPSWQYGPAPKHDCCSSLGCQCHSAQCPAVLNLSPAKVVCSYPCRLPITDAPPPVARLNEFFRPPIA
jgi:hypothetical protein